MPRKKKQKEKTRKEIQRILEYKGWKAGDRCYAVFSGDTKPSLCDILHFHPSDNITPSVSVTDVITGKYRVVPVKIISDTQKESKTLKQKWDKTYVKWKKKRDKAERDRLIAESLSPENLNTNNQK